jgi:hypothetical protein
MALLLDLDEIQHALMLSDNIPEKDIEIYVILTTIFAKTLYF